MKIDRYIKSMILSGISARRKNIAIKKMLDNKDHLNRVIYHDRYEMLLAMKMK
jgi:hypothetical protein